MWHVQLGIWERSGNSCVQATGHNDIRYIVKWMENVTGSQ